MLRQAPFSAAVSRARAPFGRAAQSPRGLAADASRAGPPV